MKNCVIVSAARTAIGSFNGALATTSAIDLGATVIKAALQRAQLDPQRVDEVIMGNVLQAGLGQNPARQALLKSGLAETVCGFTVNKVCGSGLKSVALAAQAILAGQAQDIVVAGGMENMSQAPYLLDAKARWGYRLGDGRLSDVILRDGLICATHGYHMGITAENVAKEYGISREMQDELALLSQQRACRAVDEGKFKEETVPIEVKSRKKTVLVERDEYPRKDASLEALSKLSASFKEDGTVTAGNASGMNDASSGVILASEEKARELGLPILARIISTATVGVEPDIMGIGPVDAVNKALKKAGLSLEDMERVEINEAFAAQYLACEKALNLNREITNVNGSGISLGHPVGATGIITSMIYELLRERKRYGLVAICAGGGMGTAMVLEALQKEDQEERSHV